MNRSIIVGRLTRDPELRYTPTGHAVANFNVAVKRAYKKEGEEQQADFLNCVAWRAQAENLAKFMKKGSQIGVDGRLQTRNYEGSDGKTVYVTEILAESIQFLESKGSNQAKSQPSENTEQPNQQPGKASNMGGNEDPFAQAGQAIDIADDDLPF